MYKCEGCNREITNERFESVREKENRIPTCKKCYGTFKYMGNKKGEDHNYKPDLEDDSEDDVDEDDEENNSCIICGGDNELLKWDENYCVDYDDYDYLVICKLCIDKIYPRKTEIITKVKEIIKPIRVDRAIKENSFLEKSKFD